MIDKFYSMLFVRSHIFDWFLLAIEKSNSPKLKSLVILILFIFLIKNLLKVKRFEFDES